MLDQQCDVLTVDCVLNLASVLPRRGSSGSPGCLEVVLPSICTLPEKGQAKFTAVSSFFCSVAVTAL